MESNKLEQLIEEFPKIFDKDFYFECSDGWFVLLQTLCKELQHRIDWHLREDSSNKNLQIKCSQCKEKFGGLRFYAYGGDDYMHGMISLAEAMSYKICQGCGLPGKIYNNGWIRVHCKDCEKKYQIRRTEKFSESSGILVLNDQDDKK